MSDDSLLIKIGADASNLSDAYDNIKSQTSDLEDSLAGIATISAVAFAGLTAQVGLSVAAYAKSEDASMAVTQALQAQGLYTDELKNAYKSYAEEVSSLTGISAVQLTQAQAIAQQYLGQIPVTKELTQAIADYSIKTGSVQSAAEALGKAIGTGTGMLLREGIAFSSTATEADRYQQVLDFVNARYANAATSIAPVELATKKLQNAFEESQVALGQEFAPAMTTAINLLTSFIEPTKGASNEALNFKAACIGAALVVTGLGVAIPVLAQAFLTVRAALIALNAQLSITEALFAALGVGLVALGISELVLHFGQVSAAVKSFVGDLGQLANVAKGVGQVLDGAFHFDSAKIEAGFKQITDSFKELGTAAAAGWDSANAATTKGVTTQDATLAAAAQKRHQVQLANEANNRALSAANNQLLLMQAQGASDASIALKKQEIETLKELTNKHDTDEMAALNTRLAQIREAEAKNDATELEQLKEFQAEDSAARQEHGNAVVDMSSAADQKELANFRKNTLTQEQAQKAVYLQDLKTEQQAHNTFLQEQIKYGTAYAAINQAMHSAVVQGANQAFSQLAQLQQSSNSTLKAIGKVAAIEQIVIKTAQSAMDIYAGFSTIPIVGPALGIAGAAAAVAFGGEQIGKVNSAMTGGLVGGSGFGDTQPYMLEPGELVAPRQSFDEVVNGVAQQRGYTQGGNDNSSGGTATVQISLNQNIMNFIETKIIERQRLGISILPAGALS